MSISRSRLCLLAAAGLLLGASPSFAATLSATVPVSYNTNVVNNQNAYLFPPIPQFNASLGTLTDASIEINIPNMAEYFSVKAGTSYIFDPTTFTFTPVPGYGMPYSLSSSILVASVALVNPSTTDLTTLGFSPFPPNIFVSGTVPATTYAGTLPLDDTVSVLLDTYAMPTLDSTYAVASGQLGQLIGSGTVATQFKVYATGTLPAPQAANYAYGLRSFTATATVRYTYTPINPSTPDASYLGDANLDGKITVADYARLDAGFLLNLPATWANGDFNGDGVINYLDYAFIDAGLLAYQGAASPLAQSEIAQHTAEFGAPYLAALNAAAPVPEPASLSLVALATPLLLRRRRCP